MNFLDRACREGPNRGEVIISHGCLGLTHLDPAYVFQLCKDRVGTHEMLSGR